MLAVVDSGTGLPPGTGWIAMALPSVTTDAYKEVCPALLGSHRFACGDRFRSHFLDSRTPNRNYVTMRDQNKHLSFSVEAHAR